MQQINTKTKWFIFIALACSIVMVDVDMTAVNLAISTIAHELRITLSSAKWLIDGYTMAAAVLMAFGGRAGDTFGRKKVYQIALICFMLASLAVGLAQGATSVIASRIIQGATIAFTFPLATIIVRDTFPSEQQGFAVGLLISIAALSQALGPSIGGIIINLASWRWIFFLNIPFALIAWLIIRIYLPVIKPTHDKPLDMTALSLLIVGLFSLLTALNEAVHLGLHSWSFMGLIFLGLITLTGIVYKEVTAKSPLLDLKLLMKKTFVIIISLRFLITFVYAGLLFLLGLLLQNILRYSALHAGLVMLCLTATAALLAIPAGKVIDRVGNKKPLLIGLILSFCACIALSVTQQLHSLLYLGNTLILMGAGIAFLIPATITACMQSVPSTRAGSATGLFFTCGFIGGSLGVAISGGLLSLVNHQAPTLTRQAFYTGFHWVMLLCSLLLAIALLLNLNLKNQPSA